MTGLMRHHGLQLLIGSKCGYLVRDENSAARQRESIGAESSAGTQNQMKTGMIRARGFSSHDAVRRDVETQCAELARIAEERGARVVAVKPHGALYHDVAADPRMAAMVVEAAHEALGPDITVVGSPVGAFAEAAAFDRLAYVREGFADRAYDAQGGLVARGTPGALIEDPAAAARQAVALAERGDVETICVHGDTPDAVAIARAVRLALEETDWLLPRG